MHDTKPPFRDIVRALALSSVLAGTSLAGAETPAATPESSAATTALAEDYAEQAYQAYQARRHADAIALYRKAYDTFPSADMLYNIARIYDTGLKDRPLAITFYRRYVADPGAVPERIRMANGRLAQLKEAEAVAIAVQSATRSYPRVPAAPWPGPPIRDRGEQLFWSRWRVVSVATGAAGVLALGVGAGYGLSAMAKADIVDQVCEGNLCRDQRGVDASYAARDRATLATLGVAVGGGLVAASALMFFLAPGADPPGEGQSLAFAPLATPSQMGIQVGGAF